MAATGATGYIRVSESMSDLRTVRRWALRGWRMSGYASSSLQPTGHPAVPADHQPIRPHNLTGSLGGKVVRRRATPWTIPARLRAVELVIPYYLRPRSRTPVPRFTIVCPKKTRARACLSLPVFCPPPSSLVHLQTRSVRKDP